MSATELRQGFRRRFRAVVRQIWSLHVGRGLARVVVVAAVLVAAIATADYFLELPWALRAAFLTAGAALLVALTAIWIIRPARQWHRARVAAELEGLFPRLGQRLRTATEHGERSPEELAREGVAPGLVAALEEETAEKVKPLPFQAALPVRPVLIAGAFAMVCVAAVVAVAVWVPEWRTAVERAALAPTPYTTLTATASAEAVNEGANVDIRATMSGRVRPTVVLHVREVGEPEWREETMETADGAFTARLSRLRATSEFFVSAGPERTPVKQITVRHALKLTSIHAEITSPAYTGVPLTSIENGSFSAVEGSTVKLRFELDRAPVSAALVIKAPGRTKEPPQRVELTVQDRVLSAELRLTTDIEYSIEARDADNMPLVPNRHRVRVTADQPPSVWFELPGESLEVHTLAEVLLRARARDDFGLSKVGIVFQVNNEEERILILLDVNQPNQREVKAEQVLALEQYLLTQKDCVAYYAFAEDARPGGGQRTTTELRFIDIRPFLRTYQLIDLSDQMGNGPRRELIFLDEVIARQRFNLNQTIRLESRAKALLNPAQSEKAAAFENKLAAQVEKVAAFENKLATQTHDLADFLIGLGVDGAAILAQAEEAMLSAVDSLNNTKFDRAINQQRDALRYLMEARETAQLSLRKQPPKVRAQARAFDRLQRQKLRRPSDQAETLAQIAGELAKLANEEDNVARDIAGPGDPKNGQGMDPAQEKQDEIAGQATAIDKTAAGAKGLTELAKMRIGEAAKAANEAADALGKGDRPTARKDVDRAKGLFREASKQVAILAAEEAAQQLAAARDLSNEIAAMAASNDMKTPGTGGKGDGKLPGLGGAAEKARTLKDILENLAASGFASDAEAARKAGGLLKQEDLKAAIDRLEKLGGGGDDKAERQDLADRFAAFGQKLDQAYRDTVAPRLEALARLEREANELEQRAGTADDAADMRRVRQQATEFVDRLEATGLSGLADELRNTLKNGTGVGVGEIRRTAALTHARLITKIQEFVTGDRVTTGNESVPPEYRDLVERYLRTLSAGGAK